MVEPYFSNFSPKASPREPRAHSVPDGSDAAASYCKLVVGIFLVLEVWLFPKIRGPILVVLIVRTIIYLGLFWGPLCMEAPVWAPSLYMVYSGYIRVSRLGVHTVASDCSLNRSTVWALAVAIHCGPIFLI